MPRKLRIIGVVQNNALSSLTPGEELPRLVFMARALRIEYPGAVYHVMGRGNQGQDIFGDDRDRRSFAESYHS